MLTVQPVPAHFGHMNIKSLLNRSESSTEAGSVKCEDDLESGAEEMSIDGAEDGPRERGSGGGSGGETARSAAKPPVKIAPRPPGWSIGRESSVSSENSSPPPLGTQGLAVINPAANKDAYGFLPTVSKTLEDESGRSQWKCHRPECHNKKFKCESLYRKHEATHTKPYKCTVKNCIRNNIGFSSKNDLSRHLNSVHREQGLNGLVVGYNCRYGACREKSKIYYRLDNFRNHLKKLHEKWYDRGTQLEDFIKRAECECRIEESRPSAIDLSRDMSDTASVTSASIANMMENITVANQSCETPPIDGPSGNSAISKDVTESRNSPVSPRSPGDHARWRSIPAVVNDEPEGEPMEIEYEVSPSGLDADQAHKEKEEDLWRIFYGDGLSEEDRRRLIDVRYRRACQMEFLRECIGRLTKEYERLKLEVCKERYSRQVVVGGPELEEIPRPDLDIETHKRGENCEVMVRFMTQDPKDEPYSFIAKAEGSESPRPRPSQVGRDIDLTTMNTSREPDQSNGLLSPPQEAAASMAPGSPVALEDLIRHLRSVPNKPLVSSKGRRPVPPGPRPYQCPANGCSSSFARESDLRKHSKRHSRPYGCTFTHCGRTFGSKNDWKRHENSQHHRLDSWRCQIPLLIGGECTKMVFRKETMIAHLKSPQHNIQDKAELEEKAARCHVAGASHLTSFWCGFCHALDPAEPGQKGRTVGLKKPGNAEGWDERFDHIGAHFEKGMRMPEWRHMYVPDPRLEESTDDSEEDPQQQQQRGQGPGLERLQSGPGGIEATSPQSSLNLLTDVALANAEQNCFSGRPHTHPGFHPPSTAPPVLPSPVSSPSVHSPPLAPPRPPLTVAPPPPQLDTLEPSQPLRKNRSKKPSRIDTWYCCRPHPRGEPSHPLNTEYLVSCFVCEHQRCSDCRVDVA